MSAGRVNIRTFPFSHLVFVLVALYLLGAVIEIATRKPAHDLWDSTEVYLLDTTKTKFSEQKRSIRPLDVSFRIRFIDNGTTAPFGYEMQITGRDAQSLVAHGIDADLLDGKLHTCNAQKAVDQPLGAWALTLRGAPSYVFHIPAAYNVGPEAWDYRANTMLELLTKDPYDSHTPSAVPDGHEVCENIGLLIDGLDSSRLVVVTGKDRDVLVRLNRNRKNSWPAEFLQGSRWNDRDLDHADEHGRLRML